MRRRRLLAGALAWPWCSALPAAAPALPDVALRDQHGVELRLRALLADRTVAINFIFTGCSSFCPPQTAVFRSVQARLDELRGARYAPLLLSVTLDPLNDTPQVLAQYAARFDLRLGLAQGWLMLTGVPAAVDRTVLAFGAGSRNLDDHPAQLWVGCAANAQWLRSSGLASADDVLRMMRKAAA